MSSDQAETTDPTPAALAVALEELELMAQQARSLSDGLQQRCDEVVQILQRAQGQLGPLTEATMSAQRDIGQVAETMRTVQTEVEAMAPRVTTLLDQTAAGMDGHLAPVLARLDGAATALDTAGRETREATAESQMVAMDVKETVESVRNALRSLAEEVARRPDPAVGKGTAAEGRWMTAIGLVLGVVAAMTLVVGTAALAIQLPDLTFDTLVQVQNVALTGALLVLVTAIGLCLTLVGSSDRPAVVLRSWGGVLNLLAMVGALAHLVHAGLTYAERF